MKISILCPYCEQFEKSFFYVELPQQHDCRYTLKCPLGHKFDVNILYHPFQKLFEIAIDALVDGYLREAVGSFAASYERFMELFVRVVRDSQNIDKEEFEKIWKLMSRQSERQLGAYLLAHLIEFGVKPETLANSQITLRNNVIHQGYIPTEKEAIAYGNAVNKSIRSSLNRIHGSNEHFMRLVGLINENADFGDNSPHIHFMPWHMLPTNRSKDKEEKSVEDFIQLVKKQRNRSNE